MSRSRRKPPSLVLSLIAASLLCLALLAAKASPASADTWRGTAPFCHGECLANEVKKGESKCGDGACCWTGHKALCGNATPQCQATQTKTSCYGVVMVCDNGYYQAPTSVWHSCNKYACGICFGFSFLSKKGFVADKCKQGFVWREAVADDHVCVTPATRSAAADDNGKAASRRAAHGGNFGADTCKQGFVWREATSTDHVCVTPQTRDATAADNKAAMERFETATELPFGADTCKQGFVWREAITNDHVCVPPATRTAAAADNAAASGRKQAGSDLCKDGFVWREVVPSDHVCVTPETRAQAAQDAAQADTRKESP